MNLIRNFRERTGWARCFRRTTALTALLALPLTACDVDRLLLVKDPGVLEPGQVTDQDALPTVLAAAVGDFQVAYSGNTTDEGMILWGGLFVDEFRHSDTFPTRLEVDKRSITATNSSHLGVLRRLYRARTTSEVVAAGIFRNVDPTDTGRSEVFSLAGFTYILFGEHFCNGVPFSNPNPDGSIAYGDPLTSAQIFTQRAIPAFDSAIAIAGTDARRLNLARVGKARAQLNLGQYAAAALTVAAVPDNFVYRIGSSEQSARQNNGIYNFNAVVGRWTVGYAVVGGVVVGEGTNGYPWVPDSLDPRTPNHRAQAPPLGTDPRTSAFDRATRLYLQDKYKSRADSTPLATGIEARLIEAEAALQAGDLITFVAKLDAARARFGLGTVGPAPVTRAAQEDLLFKERAYDLWITAHRMGDARRFARPPGSNNGLSGYGRGVDAVFPIGNHPKSGTYGPDVNFPLNVQELNNPKVTNNPATVYCIDRTL